MGDGFKRHGEAEGRRLGRQLGLGPTGLARRYGVEVAADEAGVVGERVGLARAAVARSGVTHSDALGAKVSKSGGERMGAERGTGGGGAAVRRGRPRAIEGAPWEAEGVSRRTWERRRKGAADG